MNCDELYELTALEALGALDDRDHERLLRRLETDAPARAELARFNAAVLALVSRLPQPVPPPALRHQIIERLAQRAAPAPPPVAEAPPLPPGFTVVRRNAAWLPAPLPGARLKVLAAAHDQGYAVLLIELPAAARYPAHDHGGTEELYLLTGNLQTEGRLLGPGDFLHAEPGTHHHELWSPDGCTALMIVPASSVPHLVRPAP